MAEEMDRTEYKEAAVIAIVLLGHLSNRQGLHHVFVIEVWTVGVFFRP